MTYDYLCRSLCAIFFSFWGTLYGIKMILSRQNAHIPQSSYIFFFVINFVINGIINVKQYLRPVICLYRYGMREISLIKSESNCKSTSSQINLHSIILLNYAFSFAEGIWSKNISLFFLPHPMFLCMNINLSIFGHNRDHWIVSLSAAILLFMIKNCGIFAELFRFGTPIITIILWFIC